MEAVSFGDNIFSRGVRVGVIIFLVEVVVVVVPFFISRRYCERTLPIIWAVVALHISYCMNSSCCVIGISCFVYREL